MDHGDVDRPKDPPPLDSICNIPSWIASVGYHIHPSIPISDTTLIGDIGCGNGIWSIELAKQLPSGAKIEAFDISLAQCPPRGWWPENVVFSEVDIFAPLPVHLAGRFDVINIRHFICVVRSGDPLPLLTALLKLLKPGGYLHWQEYDLQSSKVVVADAKGPPEFEAPNMHALLHAVLGTVGTQTTWVQDFHSSLDGPETQLVAHEHVWTAKDAIMLSQDSGYLGSHEVRTGDSNSERVAQYLQLADAAYEECLRLDRRSFTDLQMVTWVARKK
ncbi:hypothetical protein CERZMDRAFT_102675 [Cercospora zeae-maydis SCOH1-5]|uniref:Methyltransferase domain-containing protein n=1 Tax=Cercospora zeae-maydis SCOH1-5 TaxID=717836 RepID=A0A6A6F1T2_9PEZI|nr:hypothetical protein CERZMDRAFT_102675 [Cercospora zeae-maydis SCOH1-5]